MIFANQSRISVPSLALEKVSWSAFTLSNLAYNSCFQIELIGRSLFAYQANDFKGFHTIAIDTNQGCQYFHGELTNVHRSGLAETGYQFRLILETPLTTLKTARRNLLWIRESLQQCLKTLISVPMIQVQYDLTQADVEVGYYAQGAISDYDCLLNLCQIYHVALIHRFDVNGLSLLVTDRPQQMTQTSFVFLPSGNMVSNCSFVHRYSKYRYDAVTKVQLVNVDLSHDVNANIGTAIRDSGCGVWQQKQTGLSEKASLDLIAERQLDVRQLVSEICSMICCESTLQLGDIIKFDVENQTMLPDAYQVIEIQSRIKQTADEEYVSDPWCQEIWAVPVKQRFIRPPLFDEITSTGKNLPLSWQQKLEKAIPAFELAVIAGDNDEIPVDEHGCYPVYPLFSNRQFQPKYATHPLRMLHPNMGPGGHGWHMPLYGGTQVILGHLDNDIHQPVIIGVLPKEHPYSQVTRENSDELRIDHPGGGYFAMKEVNQKYQSLGIGMSTNHAVNLDDCQETSNIKHTSLGGIEVFAERGIHLSSGGSYQCHASHLNYKAEQDIFLKAGALTSITVGQDWSVITGSSWQVEVDKDLLQIDSSEATQILSDSLYSISEATYMKSQFIDMTGQNCFKIKACTGIQMCSGGSRLQLLGDALQFQAKSISFSASGIKIYQGGMANSGTGNMASFEVQEITEAGFKFLQKLKNYAHQ